MPEQATDQSDTFKKTVLVLTECLNGAFTAGHFAARMLFDSSTRIVLLYTYQQPAMGIGLMRKLTPILRKIAMEELTTLKEELLQGYGLPDDKIMKVAVEGDLKSVIESEFAHLPNISIVMGADPGQPFRNGVCRKVLRALKDSRPGPVFLISDHITIIEPSRIIVISEKEDPLSDLNMVFLKDFFGRDHLQMQIITPKKRDTLQMHENTVAHFSETIVRPDGSGQNPDRVIIDRIFNTTPA